MKTKEELNALKEEVDTLNKKLAELSEEELEQVAGGYDGYEIFFYNSQKLSETGEEEIERIAGGIAVGDWHDGGSYEYSLL